MPAVPRRLLRAAAALCFVLLAPADPEVRASDEDALSLSAEAGIAGLARAGRWLPIHIAVENGGRDVAGEIVVHAGSAVATRDISLPAPSRKHVEMYVRVPGAEIDRITVRLRSAGSELAAREVRVEVVPDDRPLSICVSVPSEDAGAATCDRTISPAGLPRSWRGLDAVDRLVWPAGREMHGVDGEQRVAIERWSRLREDHAYVAPAVRMPRATASSAPTIVLSAYAALMLTVVAVSGLLARRPWRVYAALALVVTAGVAAALGHGRAGPGSELHVVDSTVVRTGERWPGAFVTSRGSVRLPAFAEYELVAASGDVVLQPRDSAGGAVRSLEDGTGIVRGSFGKDARVEFDAEGYVDGEFLTAARTSGAMRVTNVSPYALRDCEMPAGMTPRTVARVAAGATFALGGAPEYEGAVLTCAVEGMPSALKAVRHRVRHDGAAALSYALDGR
jgi:hypothetical protein